MQLARAIRRAIERGELPAAVNLDFAIGLLQGPPMYWFVRHHQTGEGPIAVTGQDGREALAVALTIVSNIERSLPALAGRPVATSRA